jgi:hypothetical protein
MLTVSSLISLLITLLVIGIVVWLINYAVDNLPVADPIGRVIKVATMVIGVLIAVIVLLQFAGLVAPGALIVR